MELKHAMSQTDNTDSDNKEPSKPDTEAEQEQQRQELLENLEQNTLLENLKDQVDGALLESEHEALLESEYAADDFDELSAIPNSSIDVQELGSWTDRSSEVLENTEATTASDSVPVTKNNDIENDNVEVEAEIDEDIVEQVLAQIDASQAEKEAESEPAENDVLQSLDTAYYPQDESAQAEETDAAELYQNPLDINYKYDNALEDYEPQDYEAQGYEPEDQQPAQDEIDENIVAKVLAEIEAAEAEKQNTPSQENQGLETIDEVIAILNESTQYEALNLNRVDSVIEDIENLWTELKQTWQRCSERPHIVQKIEELWTSLKSAEESGVDTSLLMAQLSKGLGEESVLSQLDQVLGINTPETSAQSGWETKPELPATDTEASDAVAAILAAYTESENKDSGENALGFGLGSGLSTSQNSGQSLYQSSDQSSGLSSGSGLDGTDNNSWGTAAASDQDNVAPLFPEVQDQDSFDTLFSENTHPAQVEAGEAELLGPEVREILQRYANDAGESDFVPGQSGNSGRDEWLKNMYANLKLHSVGGNSEDTAGTPAFQDPSSEIEGYSQIEQAESADAALEALQNLGLLSNDETRTPHSTLTSDDEATPDTVTTDRVGEEVKDILARLSPADTPADSIDETVTEWDEEQAKDFHISDEEQTLLENILAGKRTDTVESEVGEIEADEYYKPGIENQAGFGVTQLVPAQDTKVEEHRPEVHINRDAAPMSTTSLDYQFKHSWEDENKIDEKDKLDYYRDTDSSSLTLPAVLLLMVLLGATALWYYLSDKGKPKPQSITTEQIENKNSTHSSSNKKETFVGNNTANTGRDVPVQNRSTEFQAPAAQSFRAEPESFNSEASENFTDPQDSDSSFVDEPGFQNQDSDSSFVDEPDFQNQNSDPEYEPAQEEASYIPPEPLEDFATTEKPFENEAAFSSESIPDQSLPALDQSLSAMSETQILELVSQSVQDLQRDSDNRLDGLFSRMNRAELDIIELREALAALELRISQVNNGDVGSQGLSDADLEQMGELRRRIEDLEQTVQNQSKRIKKQSTEIEEYKATIEAKDNDVTITLNKRGKHKGIRQEYVHIVVKGDTLWDISKRYIHNPFLYPELAKLSNIKNPHRIYPGMRVRIIKYK